MRRRLMVCVGCGTLGLVAAFPISVHLGLELPWALSGSATVGLALGYLISVMCDVFLGDVAGNLSETENQSQ